jgi:predicted esterase
MSRGLHILLAGSILLTSSCSGQSGPESRRQGGLETGKVIPEVKCASDPSCTYALYLPAGYREGDSSMVVIAFDPSARGILPVTRYQSLAGKYGFVLMGSNDSRNGQQMDAVGRIGEALVSEAKSRFRATPDKIILTGFSGGARVASIIGLFGEPVKGVIGCGAGFPETEQQPQFIFDYFVIAGESDPNLSEVIFQDKALTEAGWKHQLMVIPGGHQWPPAAEMEKAVLWMRGELPPLPRPVIPLEEYYEIGKEAEQQSLLMTKFLLGDTLWMKKEVQKLRARAAHPKTRNDSLIAERLIAFLGIMSWSKSTGQLNQGLLDQAYRSLVIYRIVEPENPAVDSLFNVYYQQRKR